MQTPARRLGLVVLIERSAERGFQRRLAAQDGSPGYLLSLPMSLGDELESFRAQGEGISLAVDGDLALEGRIEFCGHERVTTPGARRSSGCYHSSAHTPVGAYPG